MKKRYWIKGKIGDTCLACGSEIKQCHIADFCSNDHCPINYCDGIGSFDEEDLIKYAHLVGERFSIEWNK